MTGDEKQGVADDGDVSPPTVNYIINDDERSPTTPSPPPKDFKKKKHKKKMHSLPTNTEWITLFLNVDKSKFFTSHYAVLEGDIHRDVYSSRSDNNQGVLLKRQERCFVMVRGQESTSKMFQSLVPSNMNEERQRLGKKPNTTGWLRHELYGLLAAVRLPLNDDTCHKFITTNKRGIKSLDLAGEFLGLFSEETLNNIIMEQQQQQQQQGGQCSSLSRVISTQAARHQLAEESYSADNDDLLTIRQADLQERLTRHSHFAKWLLDTFGKERLNQTGTTILDVAGGNGKLSAALLDMGIHSCTILDPQPTCVERRPGLTLIAQPLEGDGSTLLSTISKDHADLIKQASIVVGLHPDEATEPAMDLALRLGKPFAVLPCCVMARKFPHRKGRHGEPVRTVHQLCRYLMDKPSIMLSNNNGTPIKVDYLPFMGRNKVLYWLGAEKAPVSCQAVDSSK